MGDWWREALARLGDGEGLTWALGILVLGVATAFLFEWIYRRVFRRLADRTSGSWDDTVLPILHRPIRDTVILIAATLAVGRIGASDSLVVAVQRSAFTLGIILWSVALVRVLSVTLRDLGRSKRVRAVQSKTVPLFDTLQKVLLTGAAVYAVMLIWHIDVTAWVASAGIMGIAVGFAARDTLANLISGVSILADSPYQIGDMIVFDTGERGRVTDVGIRSTRILTRDDVEIIIPNAAIAAAKIVNESGGPHRKRRIDVRFGVAYDSDPEVVRDILTRVANESSFACSYPEPRIRFREMADSALIFSLLFWIDDPELRGQAVDEINTAVLAAFRAANIEIPFPQRVMHWAGGAPASRSARPPEDA